MDPRDSELEAKDEIMQFIDFADAPFSSELELSEDGASSVTSSVEMPFEPLDYSSLALDNALAHDMYAASAPAPAHAHAPVHGLAVKSEPAWMSAVRDATQAYTRVAQSAAAAPLIDRVKFGPVGRTARSDPAYVDRALLDVDRGALKYQLVLDKFPDKSRVETQIKCTLTITTPDGRAPAESLLRLPPDTIMRPRFQLQDPAQLRLPEFANATLFLEIDAINPQAPHEPVAMCAKCLAREKKRAFRKKTLDPTEEQCWAEASPRRIVIINGKEVVQIRPSGVVELPLRIGCYCRHHAAKGGYELLFALRDGRGALLGFTRSSPIFITDSHKDQRRPDALHADTGPYARARSGSVSTASSTSLASLGSVRSSLSGSVGGSVGGGSAAGSVPASPSIPNWIASVPPVQPPSVLRAIPPAGPTRGGIEVTLLGTNFVPGLIAQFGDAPAVQTQFWSDTTVIAHLPPSAQAGTVAVTFQGLDSAANPAQFTYVADGDAKLQELALQMAGRTQTPAHVEQCSTTAEPLALYVLDHADEFGANVDLRNSEGQTMAHLAAMLGYASVLARLARRGAQLDAQDVSGMTPLQFACLCGQRSTARLLLRAGADPFRRTLAGDDARALADVEVLDLLPTNARAWFAQQNRRCARDVAAVAEEVLAPTRPPAQLQPLPLQQLYAKMPLALPSPPPSDSASDSGDAPGVHAGVSSKLPSGLGDGFSVEFAAGVQLDSLSELPELASADQSADQSAAPSLSGSAASSRPVSRTQSRSHSLPARSQDPARPPPYSRLFPDGPAPVAGKSGTLRRSLEAQLAHDRMLFTFWIPLLCVTLLALLTIWFMQHGESAKDAAYRRVGRWGSGVLRWVLPAVATHGRVR